MTYLVGEPETAGAPEGAVSSDGVEAVLWHRQLGAVHGAPLGQLGHLGNRLDLRHSTERHTETWHTYTH